MEKNYNVDTVVLGTVTGIKDYGVFVKLDNFHSGLIHISEIDNHFINNINDYVEMGEVIRVKIVEKCDNNLFKLSIKDVDYRITKRHDSKIKETENGFVNLAFHLDYWMNKELFNLKNEKK